MTHSHKIRLTAGLIILSGVGLIIGGAFIMAGERKSSQPSDNYQSTDSRSINVSNVPNQTRSVRQEPVKFPTTLSTTKSPEVKVNVVTPTPEIARPSPVYSQSPKNPVGISTPPSKPTIDPKSPTVEELRREAIKAGLREGEERLYKQIGSASEASYLQSFIQEDEDFTSTFFEDENL